MSAILHIETATRTCSVCLGKDGERSSLKEITEKGYSHAENLDLFIKAVLEKGGISPSELDAVAVSKGPGSYTGLRIGVSSAKGICYALGIPLIGINTLDAMVDGFLMENGPLGDKDRVIPMLDARRMEVYTKTFDGKGGMITETRALILDENSFSEGPEGGAKYLIGDGVEKARELFSGRQDIRPYPDLNPSASFMVKRAFERFEKKEFEDLAYFEPFYLKDFIPTKPSEKGV